MPTVLITGASTGIGREFAYLCAQDGYDLVLNARSQAPLAALAADIHHKTGRTVHVFARDLSEPDGAQILYNDVVCTGIKPDVLINNAGFGSLGLFWELNEAEQMRMVCLNVGALTHLTRLFLPDFIERRRGAILNVSSNAAFQPGPLMAVYFATKAYVLSFSAALHNEARDYGVKVTCLCPGPTKTDFDKRAKMDPKIFKSGAAMDARAVAKIGWDALKAGKPLVVAGRLNALMAFLTRFSPMQFNASMARRFQGKP
ncbi:MAG TPA: SDR family oxidoreductase [Bryobacteraceae bacterium]|nr:SDR family oxidoreductase [Bryobacteraceae bacterium]